MAWAAGSAANISTYFMVPPRIGYCVHPGNAPAQPISTPTANESAHLRRERSLRHRPGGGLAGGGEQESLCHSSTETLIADAAVAPVAMDQQYAYSNFGVALLGTALVRAAGARDYPSLVLERITRPLRMDRTTIAAGDGDIPATAVRGFAANGLGQPRWTGTGYLPAGSSTFTTVTVGRGVREKLGTAGWNRRRLRGSRSVGRGSPRGSDSG